MYNIQGYVYNGILNLNLKFKIQKDRLTICKFVESKLGPHFVRWIYEDTLRVLGKVNFTTKYISNWAHFTRYKNITWQDTRILHMKMIRVQTLRHQKIRAQRHLWMIYCKQHTYRVSQKSHIGPITFECINRNSCNYGRGTGWTKKSGAPWGPQL